MKYPVRPRKQVKAYQSVLMMDEVISLYIAEYWRPRDEIDQRARAMLFGIEMEQRMQIAGQDQWQ